jgi:hypothetical protein
MIDHSDLPICSALVMFALKFLLLKVFFKSLLQNCPRNCACVWRVKLDYRQATSPAIVVCMFCFFCPVTKLNYQQLKTCF